MATANRGNKRQWEWLMLCLGTTMPVHFWITEIRNWGKSTKVEGGRVSEEKEAKILYQKDKMIAEELSWKDLLKNDLENHPAWLLNYGFCHLSAPVFVRREGKNSLFDRDNHPKGFAKFSFFSKNGGGHYFCDFVLELQASLGQCSAHLFL